LPSSGAPTATTLQRRTIPGLGVEVSVLGAGCWTIGGPATNRGVPIGWDHVDPDAAYAGFLRAHELGVTLFDTADVYGLGQSERLLGRLLRQVNRDELIVSSKVGYFAGTACHPYDPEQMRRQFATTLDNFGTTHLDVYFLRSSDFGSDDEYLPGAVDVLKELREQGLIRAIEMRAPHAFAEQWADGTPHSHRRVGHAARGAARSVRHQPGRPGPGRAALRPPARPGRGRAGRLPRHRADHCHAHLPGRSA
jgi:aryl-alcohol dehydrogenase-like predicted oxidoreductase